MSGHMIFDKEDKNHTKKGEKKRKKKRKDPPQVLSYWISPCRRMKTNLPILPFTKKHIQVSEEKESYYSQHGPSVSLTKECSGLGREWLCLKICSQSVSWARMSQGLCFTMLWSHSLMKKCCQNPVQPQRLALC